MSAADFLLELRCEEIPARMQAGARRDLERLFVEELGKAGLKSGAIESYSTPRRLALIARDLPLQTEDRREELKGPRTSAPPQALEGFLRKTGLAREQLEDRDGVYFAVVETAGQGTAELLGGMIERIVGNFPWPKSMRWGEASASTASLRWVRPLHGVVAILGEDIVPVALDGVECGATTFGHRFHCPGPITIGGAGDYVEKLRACHVIVDQAERERIVRDGAARAASEAGLAIVEDEGLVVENAGLTEWPVPLLGRFDPEYLDVPREVIVLTMRANQKYFACTDAGGELAPAFVCTANIDATDGGAAIVEGNKRVLAARLSDARFFWEQDLKVPLEEQAKKLSGIIFHEKLGTIADKVERVAKLARWLVDSGVIDADADQVERAALLAKADLVTGMVGEFPELQGVIGGYLARAQGEADAVANAVRDHYGNPRDPLSAALALADKLDTICAFFSVELKPTGSKDPFALRRAAIGSIEMIVDAGLRLNLRQAVRGTLANRAAASGDEAIHRLDRNADEIMAFFADRLKVQQREAGVRHDLIDAVFALGGEDDLVRLLARVKALQAFVETENGANLLAGYKRAANILKKEEGSWTPDQVRGNGEMPAEESALAAALEGAELRAITAIDAEDFTAAMDALSSLRAPIDAFFDKVTVNADDAAVRARRLNLLMRFRDAVNRVADFSKIEG
ncbi:glycine--tRNA ligase subunit beta [Sphingomonas sinipercae]|uniref:glycine--tRNA ligase subunit beta n=1 Tax=Sphingomonas sinipercae TaxID=2714944 RepID=UPI003CCD147E